MDKKRIYINSIQDKILLLLLTICTIFMSIGYATINSIYFDITGKANANIQDGVFIVDANYLSDTNADVSNSGIDNFYQSVLKSHITLSSTDETSTITYEINLHNSSNKDYIYVGTITDKEDITYYSNKNIDFETPGLIENTTIIKGGQSLTFTITFKYIENADYNNNKLNSILNFRFKEIPILNLSNNNETYTLTNIYPDYTPQEYEFTISNYNQDYTNGVPMKYNITTDIEAPLTAKIYDSTGQEITGPIELVGNNSEYIDQTYTLKIIWDNSNPEENKRYNSYEYAGKQYECNINVVAIPDDSDYETYKINNNFKVNITTADFNFNINPTTTIGAEKTSTSLPISISNYDSNSEYNVFDTTYQISSLNNDKFNLEVDGTTSTDNILEKELKGNEKVDDNYSINLLADIYNLSENETLTLTVNSIAPYYKENTYTITIYLQKLDVRFDANGGSVSPTTLTTYKGRTYGTLPTPTWTGHTFNGWYTSSSGGTQITSTTEATTGNSTQTLYANWTSRLLSDKVKPGDMVNYDVGYSNVTITFSSTTLNLASGYTGWKVLDVVGEGDDKYVLLITSGIPLSFRCPRSTSDSTNGQKCQTALTTNFFSTSIN